MPNIVILGSCSCAPYDVTVPSKVPNAWNTEKGYEIACRKFYPAIAKADVVIVWCPMGKIGSHTKRDIVEAVRLNKRVIVITPDKVKEW